MRWGAGLVSMGLICGSWTGPARAQSVPPPTIDVSHSFIFFGWGYELEEYLVLCWDDEPQLLQLSATNLPVGAVFTDEGEGVGSLYWWPTYSQLVQGPTSIDFQCTGRGGAASATRVFDLGPGPASPGVNVWIDDFSFRPSGFVGRPMVFDIIGVTSNSGPVTLSSANLPAGATFQTVSPPGKNARAQLSWTPAPDQYGEFIFSVAADDGVETATEPVFLFIGSDDSVPDIVLSDSRVIARPTDLVYVDLLASDVDGDDVSLHMRPSSEAGVSFVPGQGRRAQGSFTWGPTTEQIGHHVFVFEATDDDGHVGEATLEVDVVPTCHLSLELPGAQTIAEGESLQLQLSVQVDHPACAPTFECVRCPSGARVTPWGELLWTPSDFQGGEGYVIEVKATSFGGDTASAEVQVLVLDRYDENNQPPVFGEPESRTSVANRQIELSIEASDPDVDDVVRLIASNLDDFPGASFDLTPGNPARGVFCWEIPEGASLSRLGDLHVLAVDDVRPNGSAQLRIPLSLDVENRAPVFEGPRGPFTVQAGHPFELTVSAVDPDGDFVHLSAGRLPGSRFDVLTGRLSWPEPRVGRWKARFFAEDTREPPGRSEMEVTITVLDEAPQQEPAGCRHRQVGNDPGAVLLHLTLMAAFLLLCRRRTVQS